MAVIAFTGANNPNPGLEDLLDPNGTVALHSGSTFHIIASPGPWQNAIFRFVSANSSFTYTGTTPTGGTIASVTVFDAEGNEIVFITNIPNINLVSVWDSLKNHGALDALATLLGTEANSITGSTGADHLTAFSSFGDVIDGGGGNDVLSNRGNNAILIGGTGSDTFLIDTGYLPAAIHGSAQNGTGGSGESDVIRFVADSVDLRLVAMTNIDVLAFDDPNGAATQKDAYLAAGQIGTALPASLQIAGSTGNFDNTVRITRPDNAAVNISLSSWQFTNFSRPNQQITVDLGAFSTNQNDQVLGSSARDSIATYGGNDTIRGGGSIDIMNGGEGDDVFLYSAGDAVAGEQAKGDVGTDTVRASGNNDFSAVTFESIERIQFTGAATLTFDTTLSGASYAVLGDGNVNRLAVSLTRSGTFTLESLTFQTWTAGTDTITLNGSAANDDITGSAARDTINGNAGRDFLSGGGENDTISGGDGLDFLSGDAGNDAINGNGGIDIIDGGPGLDVLDGGSEADTIDGGADDDVVRGGSGADNLSGGEGSDSVFGDAGIDIIDGGAGADVLHGGTESDTADGGAGADEIHGEAGNDALDGGADNDTITGDDGADAIDGGSGLDTIDGGAGNDLLAGGSGNDSINGGTGDDTIDGESGSDAMRGNAGDDRYYVEAAADKAIEAVGEGDDTVITSVSYVLAAGSEVELLRTFGSSTTAVINLTGNTLANTLQGNAAANTLDGGAGADDLYGFAGNDTYRLDSALDDVFERAGQGSDTVIAMYAGSFMLRTGVEVELLRTSGSTSSTAINFAGNEFAQTIQGNAAANTLNGGGGNDTLIGLGGSDIFVFDTKHGASNMDTIADFSTADTIHLDNAIFASLTLTGTLAAAAFRIGAAAADADDRIVYNSATGALFYDFNGNAAGGATQFAKIGTGLALTNADFVVV